MPEPIGEHNIHEYLTAFADGELDAAQNLAVLDHLRDNPAALQLMRDQQHLRLVAHRAVRASTPPMPAALRSRIEALAASAAPETAATAASVPAPRSPPAVAGRVDWRMSAAAMLLIGLGAGALAARHFLRTPAVPDRVASIDRPTPIVPVSLVSAATRVHVDCSRLAEGLHAAGYPPTFRELAASVSADLGGPAPYPDLSAIGFKYLGAGPCGKPLENTIHLLYQGVKPGSGCVSVFVQRNAGQFPLAGGKLYAVSNPDAPIPVLAWRTDRVVYFLVAENPETVEVVRRAIAGAPNP